MTPPALARLCLWFRPGTRAPWVCVAAADSEQELLDVIGESGKRHGDWWTGRTGTRPDDRPTRRPT